MRTNRTKFILEIEIESYNHPEVSLHTIRQALNYPYCKSINLVGGTTDYIETAIQPPAELAEVLAKLEFKRNEPEGF